MAAVVVAIEPGNVGSLSPQVSSFAFACQPVPREWVEYLDSSRLIRSGASKTTQFAFPSFIMSFWTV